MRPPRTFVYAATVGFPATGASVPAAEKTQEIPTGCGFESADKRVREFSEGSNQARHRNAARNGPERLPHKNTSTHTNAEEVGQSMLITGLFQRKNARL